MSNLILPTLVGMTFPVVKSPMWKTVIQEATSGKEARIGLWSYPRWTWELQYEFLRNDPANAHDELKPLLGFYNQHYGSYDSWLFDDPDDNAVVAQPFGTGDGVTTTFQLVRTAGGFVEPVTEAKFAAGAGTPSTQIFDNGVNAIANISNFNQHTGIVAFISAPVAGHALTWSGGYYWRCRFKDDNISASKFASLIWELKKLSFLSVK